jgi:molecular chaperone DnaJ
MLSPDLERERASVRSNAPTRLARRFIRHQPGDRMAAAQFRQIAEARDLSDPDRRRHYDTAGLTSAGEPAGWVRGIRFLGQRRRRIGPAFRICSLMSSASARRSVMTACRRGRGSHWAIGLTFRSGRWPACPGVTRQEHCRSCKGLGHLHAGSGASSVRSGVLKSARGHMVFSKPCTMCGGTGRQQQARCPACGGQQVETRTKR